MNLQHNPITRIDKVIEQYLAEDDVPVLYVCTTELSNMSNVPCDIFYNVEPNPKYKNRYFALYVSGGNMYVMGADSVENLTFSAVRDKNGDYIYSRYRHDFVTGKGEGVFIDGGREYTRCAADAECINFVVRFGKTIQLGEELCGKTANSPTG